ncbi:unnamed protein product [Rotaria sordida]|uniref:Prohibitin n=1 Tax=Rotaria sordida TaxID=392033 RepID=A0A814IMF1_9BILA|nr:unnamed protein product [Rotaria sordida]CAF1150809.1 unnamed protein product [Rotaria sordida]
MASFRLFNNIVDEGHRAVIFDRFQGVKLDVIEERTHFMISWLHRPIIFDIRTRPRSVPSITEIKDYEERALPSIINESQFDTIELITQRTLISQCVCELLTERAAQFSLLLDDISITHLSFRLEFTSAVELKQVAQQDVEKQRFLVEKTEQSRQANVITAEGDVRAADLIGKALDEVGDGLIELRRIEAAGSIANQLSKSKNIVYLPHDPQMLLTLLVLCNDMKDSSTTEMMNFDNLFRCFILTQSFVRGWENPFHLQEIFTYRREKIAVPSQIATAHFQLVLSRDHRFGIDSIPIGICSILLETPYYGLRKPPDQSRSSLLYITDLHFMDMIRLFMDEFTSLYNYSCSVQSNISNAMFIACIHDGYVLRNVEETLIHFPQLSCLALPLLSISVSSTTSERVFSETGSVLES